MLRHSKEWYLRKARNEPDCAIGAGVPTDRDALWHCQMLAAVGIEETDDTGPLADLFAAIHRTAATALASPAAPRSEAEERDQQETALRVALADALEQLRLVEADHERARPYEDIDACATEPDDYQARDLLWERDQLRGTIRRAEEALQSEGNYIHESRKLGGRP